MMLDDFRSTKSLGYLRAWSAAVVGRIGATGATYAQIEAHCAALVEAKLLPQHRARLSSELRQTLARLSTIGRISTDRRTDVWRLGRAGVATSVPIATTSCNA